MGVLKIYLINSQISMKKYLVMFMVLGLLVFCVPQAKASTLSDLVSDLVKEVKSLSSEISSLQTQLTGTVLNAVSGTSTTSANSGITSAGNNIGTTSALGTCSGTVTDCTQFLRANSCPKGCFANPGVNCSNHAYMAAGTSTGVTCSAYTDQTSCAKYTCTWTPTPIPVSGVCGSANGVAVSTQPTTNLCSAGSASPVVTASSGAWAWACYGSNGGSNASCSADTGTVNPTSACSLKVTLSPSSPVAQNVSSGVSGFGLESINLKAVGCDVNVSNVSIGVVQSITSQATNGYYPSNVFLNLDLRSTSSSGYVTKIGSISQISSNSNNVDTNLVIPNGTTTEIKVLGDIGTKATGAVNTSILVKAQNAKTGEIISGMSSVSGSIMTINGSTPTPALTCLPPVVTLDSSLNSSNGLLNGTNQTIFTFDVKNPNTSSDCYHLTITPSFVQTTSGGSALINNPKLWFNDSAGPQNLVFTYSQAGQIQQQGPFKLPAPLSLGFSGIGPLTGTYQVKADITYNSYPPSNSQSVGLAVGLDNLVYNYSSQSSNQITSNGAMASTGGPIFWGPVMTIIHN